MRSRVQISNHPLHPMLIVIPTGAFVMTLLCDLVYLITGWEAWWQATIPLLTLGVIGAVVAAVPGLIDLLSIAREHGAGKVGVAHMAVNLMATILFLGIALARYGAYNSPDDAFWITFFLVVIGNIFIFIGGWLGGTMVYEHRVAVIEDEESKRPDKLPEMRGGQRTTRTFSKGWGDEDSESPA